MNEKELECPACGMNEVFATGTSEEGTHYECRSCGHEWVDDSAIFEEEETEEE